MLELVFVLFFSIVFFLSLTFGVFKYFLLHSVGKNLGAFGSVGGLFLLRIFFFVGVLFHLLFDAFPLQFALLTHFDVYASSGLWDGERGRSRRHRGGGRRSAAALFVSAAESLRSSSEHLLISVALFDIRPRQRQRHTVTVGIDVPTELRYLPCKRVRLFEPFRRCQTWHAN